MSHHRRPPPSPRPVVRVETVPAGHLVRVVVVATGAVIWVRPYSDHPQFGPLADDVTHEAVAWAGRHGFDLVPAQEAG
jgi:hypothetical protein